MNIEDECFGSGPDLPLECFMCLVHSSFFAGAITLPIGDILGVATFLQESVKVPTFPASWEPLYSLLNVPDFMDFVLPRGWVLDAWPFFLAGILCIHRTQSVICLGFQFIGLSEILLADWRFRQQALAAAWALPFSDLRFKSALLKLPTLLFQFLLLI